MGVPKSEKKIAYGTSVTYSGKIGDGYFMTKGHFHRILDTAEVYYCLRGKGYIMMENPEGDWEAREVKPGSTAGHAKDIGVPCDTFLEIINEMLILRCLGKFIICSNG